MGGKIGLKDKLIKFVKKHPFLYNLAKKINRKLNRIPPKQDYQSKVVYYTYMLEEENELELIKEHYSTLQTDNSKLFIINMNKKNQINMHKWIRNNSDILFADLNYFEKYHKKALADRLMLLDYKQNKQKEVLSYINIRVN